MSTPIQLLHLTAILQFGAGVSILFFYQEMLTYVVPAKARENIIKEISKWKGQFHGVLTDKHISRLNRIIADPKLDNFKSTVTHLGKLSFVLLLVLLFIAAHEQTAQHYSYDGLLISSLIFTVYSIIAILLFINHDFYRKTASFLFAGIPIALISAIGTIYEIESKAQNLPGAEYGAYIALGSFILVILLAVSRFYYDERIAKTLWDECENLKICFEAFATWKVQPTEYNFLKIPPQIRRLYPKGVEMTPENAQERFDRFMADKIKRMLKKHPSLGYQLQLCASRQKEQILEILPKIAGCAILLGIVFIYAMAVLDKIIN